MSGPCWTPCSATSPCSPAPTRSNACGRSPPRCWSIRPRSSPTLPAHGARSQHSTTSPLLTTGTCRAAAHHHETPGHQEGRGVRAVHRPDPGRAPSMKASIRDYEPSDEELVVGLSLRAWEPVFAAVAEMLGPELFARLR